jgi:NADH:ubiquinone oxidoreductase subunit 6 (subunit J)
MAGLGPTLYGVCFTLYYGAIVGVVVYVVRFLQVDAHMRRRMRLMVYVTVLALVVTLLSSVLPETPRPTGSSRSSRCR